MAFCPNAKLFAIHYIHTNACTLFSFRRTIGMAKSEPFTESIHPVLDKLDLLRSIETIEAYRNVQKDNNITIVNNAYLFDINAASVNLWVCCFVCVFCLLSVSQCRIMHVCVYLVYGCIPIPTRDQQLHT